MRKKIKGEETNLCNGVRCVDDGGNSDPIFPAGSIQIRPLVRPDPAAAAAAAAIRIITSTSACAGSDNE